MDFWVWFMFGWSWLENDFSGEFFFPHQRIAIERKFVTGSK
jgi:hypothetical protein